MKKCSRCNNRKAKRLCPALDESICSLCCGQVREKEVHCPTNCSFLSKHKSYQEKRIVEKQHLSQRLPSSEEEDLLKDERMAWLAFHIETPVKEFAERSPSLNDREALLALEYARDKIEKGRGLVLLPDETLKPQNDLGEAMYHMIEQCRFEGRIIMTGKPLNYSQQEKLKVLDRIIGAVKYLARGNLEGSTYIQAVTERFAKMKDLSRQKKVLTIT
ncbi:MAG: hypothetical protein JSV17_06900 [Candidatus Aminicenantes bacterium]|nr:MAG: hypothetical protein JSV17_06900 [Candidatus Aminicenantes bacterium]